MECGRRRVGSWMGPGGNAVTCDLTSSIGRFQPHRIIGRPGRNSSRAGPLKFIAQCLYFILLLGCYLVYKHPHLSELTPHISELCARGWHSLVVQQSEFLRRAWS